MRLILFCILTILSTDLWGNQTILFPNACLPGSKITIAIVGDILLHKPLQIKGVFYGFENLWAASVPYFKVADITAANLEGPIASQINEQGQIINETTDYLNRNIYTGYPLFNYPPILTNAIKKSGIDIVFTANNHALDRRSIGIDKTLAELSSADLIHSGTRPRGSHQSFAPIIHKNNFKILWIACTDHTNGNIDKYNQVLYCYNKQGKSWILKTIHRFRHHVDIIIITPHWGKEYQLYPNKKQINFAHEILNAGADAVIGSHPHVLEPLQKYITNDKRHTLIMYSLGNFVSYQGSIKARTSIILLIGFTKLTNKTIISGVQFVPLFMQNRSIINKIYLEILFPGKNYLAEQILRQLLPMGNILLSPSKMNPSHCPSRLPQ